MTIVIDIGCAAHGGDVSIPHLIEDYAPSVIYGFDPAVGFYNEYTEGDTLIVERPEAAWTRDGTVGFIVAGLGGHVDPQGTETSCFDLAEFIHLKWTPKAEIILKMDAEGAEYTVLPWLVKQNADRKLKLAVIEWHCELCGIGGNGRHRDNCKADKDWWIERRERVESAMRCETAEWGW
jgi:hypothetical protein